MAPRCSSRWKLQRWLRLDIYRDNSHVGATTRNRRPHSKRNKHPKHFANGLRRPLRRASSHRLQRHREGHHVVSPPFRRANMLAINLTAVLLGIILQAGTSAQGPAPVAANYCEVVLSPADYNGKMLSVEGILHPGEHSLTLYGLSCPPKFGGNPSTEAVLPSMWVSLPHGKQLRKLLKKG